MGIHRIATIRYCLHAKLMWLAMKGYSLWSHYDHAKYFRGNVTASAAHDSPLWRSIVSHHYLLLQNTRCIVGRVSGVPIGPVLRL